MTITPAQLYWISRLDGIDNLFTFILVFGTFALVVLCIANIIEKCTPEDADSPNIQKVTSKWTKILLFPCVLALFGTLFVPTTKEMAMIYVVPAISQSEVIQKDIPELYNLGIESLKDMLKENVSKGE